MKKIVIISDSHGNGKGIEKLRGLIAENDYCIHLGDGVGDIRAIAGEYPDKIYFCAGNCDFFAHYPEEGILDVEGVRILYCHGHRYGVKSGLGTLAIKAKTVGADIALYGHTHTPMITEQDGVTLINPGSIRFSVGEGGSYCYLVVNGCKYTSVLVGDTLR